MKFHIFKHSILCFILVLGGLITSCNSDEEKVKDNSEVNEETKIKEPPFSGTIFMDPDIITDSDPTTFESITYTGQGTRTMFDRRVNDWVELNAFLFDVIYSDGISVEVQVNPEFGKDTAEVEANKYAVAIGRIPKGLKVDIKTVWIHKGVHPFGGRNNNILIHTGLGTSYENDGILEETLVHEGAHTSLDAAHIESSGWLASAKADGVFISDHASDSPLNEDVAESFLPYLAIRYRPDRISEELKNTIINTIPNRIEYFDNLTIDMKLVE